MTSIALYRRYRPQTFEDVLGQEHVTETIQAGIREDRIGHAYLFSGSRGTGKTSTARILAKALNCEKGPTPNPCNRCDSCVAITEGSSLDVIEIDAASHGGVDDVRELRENALLAPAVARKKIYIVDEAHMVSTQGWNAFLKTVEEPPDHVIFVFATTEPHKVLPTILSRCQRFDFRRVSSAQIAEHLARICKEEGIDADEGALQLIARAAEGGVRDALSTLDQLGAGGSVTLRDAARLLGSTTGDLMFEFADALASSDTGAAVQRVAQLVEEGHDLRVFARQVVEHLRALLLTKEVPDPGELIDATEETRARLAAQADAFGNARLLHSLRAFVDALSEMRQQAAPRLSVELAVVRVTMPEADDSAAAAVARIERLERLLEVQHGGTAAATLEAAPKVTPTQPKEDTPQKTDGAPSAQPRAKASKKAPQAPKAASEPTAASAPETAAQIVDLDMLRRSWPVVLEEIRKESRKLHALLGDAGVHSFEGKTLTVEVRFPIHADMVMEQKNSTVIARAVSSVFGVTPVVKAVVGARSTDPGETIDVVDDSSADPLDVLKSGFGDDLVEE
ncbi:MAG: DNA polymerase III subunit gamma/tau [Actinomycetota bacterium]